MSKVYIKLSDGEKVVVSADDIDYKDTWVIIKNYSIGNERATYIPIDKIDVISTDKSVYDGIVNTSIECGIIGNFKSGNINIYDGLITFGDYKRAALVSPSIRCEIYREYGWTLFDTTYGGDEPIRYIKSGFERTFEDAKKRIIDELNEDIGNIGFVIDFTNIHEVNHKAFGFYK